MTAKEFVYMLFVPNGTEVYMHTGVVHGDFILGEETTRLMRGNDTMLCPMKYFDFEVTRIEVSDSRVQPQELTIYAVLKA